jgi:hypothetical protein
VSLGHFIHRWRDESRTLGTALMTSLVALRASREDEVSLGNTAFF